MQEYYLAIDLGASSGRHILGCVEHGKIILEEIYRFEHVQIYKNGHVCWNVEEIYAHILKGLKICKKKGKIPKTIGIDTWAVDYVLLNKERKLCGDCVSYRDGRTVNMENLVYSHISAKELYDRTGIQKQIFNTIYQLAVQKQEHPEELEKAAYFLMLPEYLNFLLTGNIMNEYTNATSTNLVNAETKKWDYEIIKKMGFPEKIFGELKTPGAVVGELKESVVQQIGFRSTVILPATHDTACAYLAVPSMDKFGIYLSSGTWSLMGVENREAITTEESYIKNFTNEGGYEYRFRYLKNIMGLWMLQSIRRELNGVAYIERKGKECKRKAVQIGFQELSDMAKAAADFPSVVDVNDSRFLSPESMIQEIKDACKESGQKVPLTLGEVLQCVYQSLAICYAETVETLTKLTGRRYRRIHIVGGGCQDQYLNEITAKITQLPVYAGPIEGTALGNLAVQMIHDKVFETLQNAREAIACSFEIKKIDCCGILEGES